MGEVHSKGIFIYGNGNTGAMVLHTDASLCHGCQACALGCSLWHEGECNLSLSRVLVTKDMERYEFNIQVCQNCESQDCVAVCPSEALVINRQGIVVLVEENCTQCGNCVDACPYQAVFYNETLDKYFKCDMCAGRTEGPLCVALCPVGALTLVKRTAKGGVLG